MSITQNGLNSKQHTPAPTMSCLPSIPLVSIMTPKLGQAVRTKPDGVGPASAAVQVNGSSVRCAVGIELDSILPPAEGNAVATPGIYLSVVGPTLGAPKLKGVCFEVDACECGQGPYGVAFFQIFLFPVVVAVFPVDTFPIQRAIIIEVEIEIAAGALRDGLTPCLVNLHHQCTHGPD